MRSCRSIWDRAICLLVSQLRSIWHVSLLDEKSVVLQALGKHFPFEVAIGVNGRVYINSMTPVQTVLIANAILNSEHMKPKGVQDMVQKLVNMVS